MRTKHAYTILSGKLDRKRSLGRPMHRWEENIKKGLNKIR
jgi:hypothetical protein